MNIASFHTTFDICLSVIRLPCFYCKYFPRTSHCMSVKICNGVWANIANSRIFFCGVLRHSIILSLRYAFCKHNVAFPSLINSASHYLSCFNSPSSHRTTSRYRSNLSDNQVAGHTHATASARSLHLIPPHIPLSQQATRSGSALVILCNISSAPLTLPLYWSNNKHKTKSK